MSKMLHQAVVGLENNDQEDSREKHPMIIIDDGQMLICLILLLAGAFA